MRQRTRWYTTLVAIAIAVPIGAAMMTEPAAAAPLPSTCAANSTHNGLLTRLCLFWGGNGSGSIFYEHGESRADYHGLRFPNDGRSGQGSLVKNNAASVANDTFTSAYVFFNEHCSGAFDSIPPFSLQNLVQTWNDEASYENPFLGDGTRGNC